MKWVSHITLTGTIAYAVTADPLLTAAAALGAVLPDKIEGSPQSVGWRTWRSRHRGWSHWPLLYLALIGGLTEAQRYLLRPHMALGRCALPHRRGCPLRESALPLSHTKDRNTALYRRLAARI